MTAEAIVVTTTAATRDEAERLTDLLLDSGLAACVQLSEIDSHYRWNGETVREPETQLSIKTLRSLFPAIEAVVRAAHDYETPQIIATQATAVSDDYLAWIETATGGDND